jgi:hypothetical protein
MLPSSGRSIREARNQYEVGTCSAVHNQCCEKSYICYCVHKSLSLVSILSQTIFTNFPCTEREGRERMKGLCLTSAQRWQGLCLN